MRLGEIVASSRYVWTGADLVQNGPPADPPQRGCGHATGRADQACEQCHLSWQSTEGRWDCRGVHRAQARRSHSCFQTVSKCMETREHYA
eukprot:2060674-Pyramimonas_sp.AAC.1